MGMSHWVSEQVVPYLHSAKAYVVHSLRSISGATPANLFTASIVGRQFKTMVQYVHLSVELNKRWFLNWNPDPTRSSASV